jgi:hypothetical protein
MIVDSPGDGEGESVVKKSRFSERQIASILKDWEAGTCDAVAASTASIPTRCGHSSTTTAPSAPTTSAWVTSFGVIRLRGRFRAWPTTRRRTTLDVVGGRWKAILMVHLLTTPAVRFGEFRRRLPGAAQRMLTLQLRELERDGCIDRKVYAEVPP